MKERDRGSHRLAFPQQKLFPYPPSRYHLCGKNPLSLLFIPSASPLLFSLLFPHLPFPLRRRFGPNGNDKGRGKGKISTWRTVQKRDLGWAGSAVEGHHTCLASNMVVFSEEKVRWSFFFFSSAALESLFSSHPFGLTETKVFRVPLRGILLSPRPFPTC